MYRNVLRLLLLPRFRFLVIALLFDFFPLNQIDQDIHTKYTLSSDAELILIRSLTLGKVTSKSSHYAQIIAEKKLWRHPPVVLLVGQFPGTILLSSFTWLLRNDCNSRNQTCH